ncbi:MAG: peroxiredoxin [Oligoflexia bacterium]|nr:peroxiredoxin [Oligoflexia bacterium]
MALIGDGQVVAKKAPDFELRDHKGGVVKLSEALRVAPALLVFYPGDFTPVCTAQLCNYRDNFESLIKHGVQVFGISQNTPEEHAKFAGEYDFPFLLLSDPGNAVAKAYGCTSILMFGKVSRAVFIVNTKGIILYRYVEPVAITHRKADELVKVLSDLKENNLI